MPMQVHYDFQASVWRYNAASSWFFVSRFQANLLLKSVNFSVRLKKALVECLFPVRLVKRLGKPLFGSTRSAMGIYYP